VVQTEVKKECPSCGLGVHLEATVCEFCGWDFEEEDEWILQIEKLERELLLEKQKYAPGSIEAAVLSTLRPPTLERVEPTPAPSAEAPPPPASPAAEPPPPRKAAPSPGVLPSLEEELEALMPTPPAPAVREPPPGREEEQEFPEVPEPTPRVAPARPPAPPRAARAPPARAAPPKAPARKGGGLRGLFAWPGGPSGQPAPAATAQQRRIVRRVRSGGEKEPSVATMRAEAEAEATAAKDLIHRTGAGRQPPVEVFLCPVCHQVVPAEALQCPSCGAEFAEGG